MSKKRFVLDTNVVISALLLKQSLSRKAFDKARSDGNLLLSIAVLDELNTTLRREKFNKYLTEEERLQFLSALVQEAAMVEISEIVTDCRDPKDNKFLELAISGQADCIISGDDDLKSLNPFRDIPILTPREFVEQE